MAKPNTQIERLRQVVKDSQTNQHRDAAQTIDRLQRVTRQSQDQAPKPPLREAVSSR